MQDAAPVCIIHRAGNRCQQARGVPGRDRPVRQPSRQRLALDQPHDEVRLPFVISDRINRHDVRMIELGRRARLGAEPSHVQRRGRRRV